MSALQSYGTFNTIAETRIATVGTLAIGRIDYERLMRETGDGAAHGRLVDGDGRRGGQRPGRTAASTTPTCTGTPSTATDRRT